MTAGQKHILAAVNRCIAANLKDPTHEMRVAFERLTKVHKVLLFALIDVDSNSVLTQKNDLVLLATKLVPASDDADFNQLLRELSEGFVRISPVKVDVKRTYQQIQWIHPSCRDLAIEELGRSQRFRQKFLQTCSMSGVEVAISIGGGATGDRALPLLQGANDWQQLVRRCVELVPKNPELLSTFVSTISQLQKEDARQPRLGPLREAAAATLHAYASGREHWDARNLKLFLELRRLLNVTQPIPSLRSFFDDECVSLTEGVENESESITEWASPLSSFAQFCLVLSLNAPDETKFLFDSGAFKHFSLAFEKRAEYEVDCDYIPSDWSADALNSESEYYVELAEACRTFSSIKVSNKRPLLSLDDYSWRFDSEADSLAEAAAKKNPVPDYEPDGETDEKPPESAAEDLQRIFNDL